MNTDTLTSGSTFKNHISLKTVFGYRAALSTSFRSWFLVHQGVLPPACLPHQPWHLQLCQAKVWLDKHAETCVEQIPIPQLCHMLKGKNGETCVLLEPQKSSCWLSQPKIRNQRKIWIPIKNGETCVIPTSREGCKSSEKILWMTEFLNTETRMQILLMNYPWSPLRRTMDPIISVQNKNFSGDTKELAKVLGAK